MQAVSIWPEWAHAIYAGAKRVEVRSWRVKAPCDLLMCTSKRKYDYFPAGYAVALLHVEACVPMHAGLLEDACMDEMPEGNQFAWVLTACWPIEPFEVKGSMHIFEVDKDENELNFLQSDEEIFAALKPITPMMPDTLEEARRTEGFDCIFASSEA